MRQATQELTLIQGCLSSWPLPTMPINYQLDGNKFFVNTIFNFIVFIFNLLRLIEINVQVLYINDVNNSRNSAAKIQLCLQIIKVDTETGDFKIWHEPHCYPSEPIFIRHPDAKVRYCYLKLLAYCVFPASLTFHEIHGQPFPLDKCRSVGSTHLCQYYGEFRALQIS